MTAPLPRKPSYDRDALISKARDIFWRQGWAGTSLKDLERELKLKPGSFYAAFGSKDRLYALALERYAQEGLERLDALVDDIGPMAALKRHPMAILDYDKSATQACMLAKTYLELNALGHELSHNAASQLSRVETRFAEIFAAAQVKGEIGPQHDPNLLAQRYQSDILGMRISAERTDVNAQAIAEDISARLDRL